MLTKLLYDGAVFLQNELGFSPVDSTLTLHSQRSWTRFGKQRGKDYECLRGVYLRKQKAAHVCKDVLHYKTTIFHEYFGHGIYYEHSLKAWPKNDQRFSLPYSCINEREGFATWIDGIVCEQFDLMDAFEKKKRILPREYVIAREQFLDIEKRLGRKGLLVHLGFPVPLTQKMLEEYHTLRFGPSQLILSEGIPSVFHGAKIVRVCEQQSPLVDEGWLKVKTLSQEQFLTLLAKNDPRVSNLLLRGTVIGGDPELCKRLSAQQEVHFPE